MAISIGHKTLIFLGFMLLALGLVGCGDSGPSQADIDATVEARVDIAKASFGNLISDQLQLGQHFLDNNS